MEFTYENQGTNTYLVYKIEENDVVDSMSLGMLTNNKIPGLSSALFTQMDDDRFIKYNVTAKISAKEIFMGAVNRKRLLGVLSGIVSAISSAEEYMIDPKTLLLDMEYIFSDVSTCETILICLPVESDEKKEVDFGAFFKNIVFSTRYDQTENCDYVAKLINYLNGTPAFSLGEFKSILDELSNINQPKQTVPQAQPVSQQVSQPVKQPIVSPQPVQQPMQQKVQPTTSAPQQYNNSVPNQQMQPRQPLQQPQMQQRPAQPVNQPVQQGNTVAKGNDEKKMSMLHLMMHYSKENAQIYKEQHNKANNPKVQQPVPLPGNNRGFAIPGQQAAAIKPMPAQPKQPVSQPIQQSVQQPVQQQNSNPQSLQQSVQQQMQPTFGARTANFGDTTVLSTGAETRIGETTVLSGESGMAAVEPRPYLIRTKYNERILIDKPVFRIGKEKSYVDYFVSDNTAVSRSHANIIEKGKDYYVVDTNSTNHTFVNGTMIQSNTETLIKPGDKIKLANEEFEFRII